MSAPASDIEVVDATERSRFEILVDGALAGFTEYQDRGDGLLSFPHTEIDPAYGGRGLGGTLVGRALAAVDERGQQILPFCPFVLKYVQRHPDLVRLVPEDRRERFGL
ncbi:GNAT family N-acetyltransferase [Nakamurella flava]|uniref:GNAT family N-acetyltransferase n=1 Tax=Nakamurella flava TaxID=2576308 RepID=UPI00197BAEA5|nr:GNAT family N-acetyltransferase [Nakamurella flava]